ncbi:hypothetical protein GLYMA_18G263100v4 [Glycine max]|uniref:Uncharacterized protein n=1 Tax=Glycine max TaxID=3847 RepID=K7MUW0_SOYBN|nr:hypothetical protein JHK86_051504 [Glycine max]KAG4925847.1 hypothetical protein JHK87_051387 [Glycine soja]KAG4937450.1 hypothetical protein JHK85_052369 [Glycine max]KAG5095952.1 hypothetical protein JHK84_051540 [Glycine max]KAH1156255.1 hypothetical protein GYH30_051172 [Glycine max]
MFRELSLWSKVKSNITLQSLPTKVYPKWSLLVGFAVFVFTFFKTKVCCYSSPNAVVSCHLVINLVVYEKCNALDYKFH